MRRTRCGLRGRRSIEESSETILLSPALSTGWHKWIIRKQCDYRLQKNTSWESFPRTCAMNMKSISLIARNVNATRGAARSQIEFSVEKALRRVIVRIHDDGRKVQLARLLRNAVCFHRTRQEHAGCSARTCAQNRSHHSTSPCSPIALPASLC